MILGSLLGSKRVASEREMGLEQFLSLRVRHRACMSMVPQPTGPSPVPDSGCKCLQPRNGA